MSRPSTENLINLLSKLQVLLSQLEQQSQQWKDARDLEQPIVKARQVIEQAERQVSRTLR